MDLNYILCSKRKRIPISSHRCFSFPGKIRSLLKFKSERIECIPKMNLDFRLIKLPQEMPNMPSQKNVGNLERGLLHLRAEVKSPERFEQVLTSTLREKQIIFSIK